MKLQRNGQLWFNKYFYEFYYKKRVKFYAFSTKRTNEQFDQSFVLFLGLNLGGNGRDTRIKKSARVSPYIIVLKGFMELPIP